MNDLNSDKISLTTHYLPAERSSDEAIRAGAKLISDMKLAMAVLETMPGGAVVLDENRQIIAANRSLCNLLGLESQNDALGYRPGELLGCRIPEIAPGSCGTGRECEYCGLVNTVVQSLTSDSTQQGECSITCKDGSALEFAVAATAHNVEGKSIVFVGLQDISGQKRRQVLERIFFHDIMNTAGGVLGSLECLKDTLGTSHETKLAESSCELAANLVDEIRAQRQLLAAERDDLGTSFTTASLRHLIESTVRLYQNHSVSRDRILKLDQVSDVTLETDENIFRRIVGNMIKNALEAVPQGAQVTVNAVESGDAILINVANPGVIPLEVQMQLFKRSFSTKGVGRGVGTYSMKLLGERFLKGTVTFTSHEGHGTEFTFSHPKQTAAGIETVPDEIDHQLTIPEQLKILVVEDNVVNRMVARTIIQKIGWDVDIAENGSDALVKLQAETFDVVLMDVNMPGMDGLEATRTLRNLDSDMRNVIVFGLTAGESDREHRDCLAAGMNSVLHKPLSIEQLKIEISKAMN